MSLISRWLGGEKLESWFQRLRGEVLIVFLSRLANAAVGFAFVVITGRHLGPVGRGEIALAFTIAWATTHVANAGTPTSGRIRLLRPTDPVGPRDVVSLSIALLPLQALLVAASVGVISLTSFYMTWEFSLAIFALSLATMLFNSAVAVLYGLRRYRNVLMAEVIIGVSEAFVVVGLLMSGRLSSTSAILTMALGLVLGASWLIGQVVQVRQKAGLGLTTHWRSLITDGFYPMLGQVSIFIALRSDRAILAAVAGADSLGLYVVALAIPETLRIVPKAFGQVIADRGRSGVDPVKAVRRYARLFVVAQVLILGISAVVGSTLLLAVFGEGFREALGILAIVTIAEMVLSIYFMYQSLLVGFSRPRGIGPPQVLGGAVAVLLNLVMIPEWGMRGAAYACLLGHVALAVISGIWTNRELRRLDA